MIEDPSYQSPWLMLAIGRRWKAAREAAGLSQAVLAERMDVSVSTVRNWEAGRRAPSLETMIALSKVLRVDLAWVLEPVGQPCTIDRHFPDGRDRNTALQLLRNYAALSPRSRVAVRTLAATLADDENGGPAT